MGHGDAAYYAAEKKGDGEGFEVGKLDPEKLSLTPILELKKKEIGEISPFIAVSKDGTGIAILVKKGGEKTEAQSLLVFRGKDLEKTVPVGPPEEVGSLGDTQWSPDGMTIYAASAKKLKDGDGLQLGFIEVPLGGGGARQVPLVRMGKEDEDKVVMFFQIALSPDGKTLAASTGNLPEELKDEDRALYLVDLASPERKVTKVRAPISAAPAEAGKVEKK